MRCFSIPAIDSDRGVKPLFKPRHNTPGDERLFAIFVCTKTCKDPLAYFCWSLRHADRQTACLASVPPSNVELHGRPIVGRMKLDSCNGRSIDQLGFATCAPPLRCQLLAGAAAAAAAAAAVEAVRTVRSESGAQRTHRAGSPVVPRIAVRRSGLSVLRSSECRRGWQFDESTELLLLPRVLGVSRPTGHLRPTRRIVLSMRSDYS
jgi:hypothetical protein